MTLTDEQQEKVNILVDWYHSPITKPEDYFYTLEGFAGTGKTTVVDFVIKNTTRKVVVSAPTHKAKQVIQEKTGCIGETLQALLGLRLDMDVENFHPTKMMFNVKAQEKLMYYNLIIIDEASMINIALLKLIKEKAILNKKKVLFIGDRYQLMPVKEKTISKVFTTIKSIKLDKILRQAEDNPNTKLIEIARNDVIYQTNKLIPYINTINQDYHDGIGWQKLNPESFYDTCLEHYYNSEYKLNPDYAKILAYDNISVGKINRYIKSKVTDIKEHISKGDILTGYNNISEQIDAPPYYIPVIVNSADYIVDMVELIEIPIEGVILKGYRTKLLHMMFPLFILHPDSYDTFEEAIKLRLNAAKESKRWTGYYRFKNKIHLMKEIRDKNNPDPKTNLLCKKDIDYGYALTIHKSQGSTYNYVGTVIKTVQDAYCDAQLKRQLLYVGLSRTSTTNYLYG